MTVSKRSFPIAPPLPRVVESAHTADIMQDQLSFLIRNHTDRFIV
jgi:hypothetical protein